jgi:ATP-dependent DNA helicase RecG
MDIRKLSQLGEGKTLEYKRNTDSLFSILKSVVAFANTAGGIILIGVEDNGEIVGVEHPNRVQEQLSNSISNRVWPHLLSDISTEIIDTFAVVCVQIEHSLGPYYLSDKGEKNSTYVRIGNTNHLAGPEIIEEIKRTNHYSTFDQSPCYKVTELDLDKERIHSIYASRSRQIDMSKLISAGILAKKGKHIYATNGGVILFGLPEIRESYFPYAEVRCARFKGVSRSEFIDRLNIEGGVLSAIEEVLKFIRRNTRMAGKFGEMRRRDIAEYLPEGIREVLTNAIAHQLCIA